ncbi:hypothetical protein Tco_0443171 [Tanacetum coccineum]
MRFPPFDDNTCHSIDMIDLSILDHVQKILPSEPFDSFLFEPINHHLPTKINSLWDDNKREQDLINQISGDLEPESGGYTKPTLLRQTCLRERNLPPNLRTYLPIWNMLSLSIIKNSPLLFLHYYLPKKRNYFLKFLQNIRVLWHERLNPKVQDVVKAKIVKLLDAGLIYAISHSPWTSWKFSWMTSLFLETPSTLVSTIYPRYTLSIDDLYNNLRVFEQEIQGASKTSSSAQNVAFVSQSKSNTNKVKSGFTSAYSTCTPSTSSTNTPEKEALAGFADEVIYSLFAKQSEDWDLLHEDLEQIDDLDIEEMDIMAKGTHDGKKKRDSFYQHQEAGKQEKNQMGLLTMDDGIVNWGEHTKDEETNHALMAISSSSEVSLCSKTCIDSYNTLKTLCDEQMNQLGDQEAQILAYRQAVTKLEAQLCKIGLEKDSVGKPLYSRFTKTNDFKGVPHLLSGDYTLNHKKKLMSPRCMFMIKRDPKSLKPSVSDDRSSEYSTCQSNDSAGSIRTSSVHSVDLESKISRVPQEVYVSKHTTTQMKKGKYSSTKKKCFVCGSLCHLIKDCDYYEKKMAREAGFKKQRVFNTGNMVAKPVWTNDDRINHDNQFVPRLVQLNAGRPNINSVRPNINTGIAWICSCKEVLISLCLRKPDESAGFAEIVDFLRGSNLRYALTTNPTIYDSLVKQFGRCYMPKLLADGLLELKQLLDTIVGQEALSITQPQPSSRVVPPTPPITQPIPSEATTILPLSQPAPLIPIAETTTASPSPTPSPCPT